MLLCVLRSGEMHERSLDPGLCVALCTEKWRNAREKFRPRSLCCFVYWEIEKCTRERSLDPDLCVALCTEKWRNAWEKFRPRSLCCLVYQEVEKDVKLIWTEVFVLVSVEIHEERWACNLYGNLTLCFAEIQNLSSTLELYTQWMPSSKCCFYCCKS